MRHVNVLLAGGASDDLENRKHLLTGEIRCFTNGPKRL